jgi:hypothetical protein
MSQHSALMGTRVEVPALDVVVGQFPLHKRHGVNSMSLFKMNDYV